MKKLTKRLLLAIALTTVLTACLGTQTIETIGVPQTTNDIVEKVCGQWRKISFSATKDTSQTISEIRGNNAARKAFCGN